MRILPGWTCYHPRAGRMPLLVLLLLGDPGQPSAKPGTQSRSVLVPNFSLRRAAPLQAQLNQLIIEAASPGNALLCAYS